MTNPKDDDPFSWDIDRVVQELCSPKRTWIPTPRMQFPDATDLEAKLRDGEYDGELLLHSLTNEADLWSDLGIVKGKFKQTIRTAIAQLRTRSPEYRKYERSLRFAPDDELSLKKENRFLSPGLTDIATPASAPVDGQTSEQTHCEALTQTTCAVMQNDLRHARNDDSETTAKPMKKQRRLDATGLTSVDLPARDTAISTAVLTEADRFTISNQPSNLLDRLISGPGAYWGEGKLTLEDLFGHDEPEVSDTQEFGWVQSQRIGRAKAKWASNKMKKFLREPPLLQDADTDDLPPFGESDEEDNPVWDLIEREIEEEEEEVRQEKLRIQATSLHSDEMHATIQKMIQNLIALWQETKLPVQQRKAYKIWKQAQQSGTRNQQIIQLTQSLRNESTRLEGKVSYLRDNSYSSRKELYGMKPTLEPTVFEIEKIKWTITVLRGSRAPAKPDKVSVPSAPRARKNPKISSDGGIDIWSEDELEDFIVNDDPPFRVADDDSSLHFAEDKLPDISNQADDAMDVDMDAMDIDAPQPRNPGQSFGSTSDGDVEMFDLTQVDTAHDPIALDTPIKSKSKTKPVSPTPSDQDDGQLPFSGPEAIAEKGTEYWRTKGDYHRLLVTLIHNLSTQRRVKVLESAIYSDTHEELWQDQIEAAFKFHAGDRNGEQPSDKVRRDVAMSVARFFHVFCGSYRSVGIERFSAAWQGVLQKVKEQKIHQFEGFWSFLRFLAPFFNVKPIDQEDILSKSLDFEEEDEMTAHQKSTKARLQKSARIRLHEAYSSQAKEARRLEFRALAQVAGGTAGLVINESKEAGQGLVYVHPDIAPKIRQHQLAGVRFMWDEITKDTHKGCLLAHTMGLGKTMQTITLLCALAEAGASEDETVSIQIPDHLKIMKVIILCPVNVLSNWVEELYHWTPHNLLGHFYKLESSVKEGDRSQVVEEWAMEAGCSVLCLGYSFLISLKDDVRQRILDVCSIVIGDEAHTFKNRLTKTGMAVNAFKTTSRIALTGSPLSNNVKEYYSMIDWVAPGFLGDSGEFNSRYGNPIEEGLSARSDRGAARKAKVLLAALKKLVETKVHRMSMQALKGDLPPKVEFIIYLDLSEIQIAAYKAYLQGDLRNRPKGKSLVNNVWALQAVLPLLLGHPSIYHRKLKEDRAKIVDDMKEIKAIATEAEQPQEGSPDEGSPDAPTGIPSATVFDALKVFDEPEKYNALGASYKMLVLDKILEESLKLGDNVLVFSQKIPILDYIEEHLIDRKSRMCYRIDGSVKPNTRQAKVHKFNRCHGAVFLISTTAGGVGLNLQGANRVVIMDSQYNPTHEQQAVARAWRMGQNKPVFVYWLLCDGTFEKTMQSKQIFKTQLSSRVVDDKAPIAKFDRDLRQWFTQPVQVPHQDTSSFRGKDPVLDALLESEITAGISSMETTDTFEEEEEDRELGPDELEQANQMALGNISELSLPEFKDVQQPPTLNPIAVVAPSTHPAKAGSTTGSLAFTAFSNVRQTLVLRPLRVITPPTHPSEAGNTGSSLPLNQEASHQMPLNGTEACQKEEDCSTVDYAGPEILARRFSRTSTPGDMESTVQASADPYHLLDLTKMHNSANIPTQTPVGIGSTQPGPGTGHISMGITPPGITQTTPLPFCMPGAEQVRKRVILGGNDQSGFGIPKSQTFSPLPDTPQPFVAQQQPNQQFSHAGSSKASGHVNGASGVPVSRTTGLPISMMPQIIQKAKESFKVVLRNALGPSMILQSETFIASIDQMIAAKISPDYPKQVIWNKLEHVIQSHAKAAEAMVSQQISPQTLVTASEAQVLLELGIRARQDPDVGDPFL